jgi:hypothetical protein
MKTVFFKYRGSRASGFTPWYTDCHEFEDNASLYAIRKAIKNMVEDAEGDGIRPVRFQILSKPPLDWIEKMIANERSHIRTSVETIRNWQNFLKKVEGR